MFLSTIEEKLIEKHKRLTQLKESVYNNTVMTNPNFEIGEIESEIKILEMKRTFALDRRNGWGSKIIWSIIAPCIVAIIITITTSYLLK